MRKKKELVCIDCKTKTELIGDDYCPICNEWHWRIWEKEHRRELLNIEIIKEKGHSHHCACRQVWGDGECECDLYEMGYDPYAWMKGNYKL